MSKPIDFDRDPFNRLLVGDNPVSKHPSKQVSHKASKPVNQQVSIQAGQQKRKITYRISGETLNKLDLLKINLKMKGIKKTCENLVEEALIELLKRYEGNR